MHEHENDYIDFDSLCECGDPTCVVSLAAQTAKKLYYNDGVVTKKEARRLAAAYAGAVVIIKELTRELNLASTALEMLLGEQDEEPRQQQQRRNPFGG